MLGNLASDLIAQGEREPLQLVPSSKRSIRFARPATCASLGSNAREGTLDVRELAQIVQEKDSHEADREAVLRKELENRAGQWRPGPMNAKFGWLGRRPIRPRVTERTINYELLVLNTWFRWAIRQNLLFLNPLTGVDKFRVPKRALPKFMTSEELKKFFAACNGAQRRLFMAILLTGMRKGEAEHLRWSDISLQLGVDGSATSQR